jgi:hypothetical protein
MPAALVSAPIEIVCNEMFNFALDRDHIVLVNNIECVTLGHEFQDDVVRHAYYGSQRVIDDLRQLDAEQNRSGIVELSSNLLIRSEHSGLVDGLKAVVERPLYDICVR